MKFSVRNFEDGIEIKVELLASDLSFISRERFDELMPAIRELRDIPNKRDVTQDGQSYEISRIEFAKFILALNKHDFNKINTRKTLVNLSKD
jgi:hypothetical protein